jgi:aldose 1-epimerase
VTAFTERTDGILEQSTARSSIAVDPADGGRLVSLRIDGMEVLGASVPAPGAPPQIFSGSFVMAPFVGRTAHGRFDFEGESYTLPTNFGAHAMHGFVFDRAWRREGDELVIDFDDRWPFGGQVRQRFELGENGLTVTATVSNDERRMPVIAGFHPWFAETLADGRSASYEFVPGTRYLCDESGIPISTVPGGGDRPWDDSFTDVASDPVVWWAGGPSLTLGRTGTHWIVCETMPNAFCVEPLSGPVNGLATGDFTVVGPGSPLTHSLAITWP